MDENASRTSRAKVDKLLRHLEHPKTDCVTHAELWDVFDLSDLEKPLQDLDSKLKETRDELRDALLPGASPLPTVDHCRLNRTDGSCEIADTVGKNNHGIVSRRLRRYKEVQQERSALHDYRQRRIIKEKMEATFGPRAYDWLEKGILVLISVVLFALVVEYSYFQVEFDNGLFDVSKELLGISVTLKYIAYLDLFAGAIFLAEYSLRLAFSQDKGWYIRNHKIDFLSSIPLTGIFVVGGFGAGVHDFMFLRIIRLLRIFRALRIASFLWRGMERLEQVGSIRMIKKSVVILIAITVLGSALIVFTEGHHVEGLPPDTSSQQAGVASGAQANPPVTQARADGSGARQGPTDEARLRETFPGEDQKFATDFDQSVWWTITTLTSGGFGDLWKPKTKSGWALTIFLVIAGIVVVGVFTAALTSIFRGDDAQEILHRQQNSLDLLEPMPNTLEGLVAEVRETREMLASALAQIEGLKKGGVAEVGVTESPGAPGGA